jgi:hypothetical protein
VFVECGRGDQFILVFNQFIHPVVFVDSGRLLLIERYDLVFGRRLAGCVLVGFQQSVEILQREVLFSPEGPSLLDIISEHFNVDEFLEDVLEV